MMLQHTWQKLELAGIIVMSIGIISGGIMMFWTGGDTRIPGVNIVIGFVLFMISMFIGVFRMLTR